MLFRSLGISIVSTPPYVEEFQISEKMLETEMEAVGLKYRFDAAKRADIQSIRSAYVLRAGRNPKRIEDCNALVLTNNSTLARAAYEYGKKNHEFQHISPVVTDFSLTNLLWLKSPVKFGNVPEKILAASCFAALRPTEQIWTKFVEEIDKLKARKDITEKQHAFLRYDSKVKSELVGLTYGNSDRVSNEIVMQILSSRENEILKPYAKKCENLENIVKEKETQIQVQREKIDRQNEKFIKTGKLIEKFINGVFLIFGLILFTYVSLNDKMKDQGLGFFSLDRNFEMLAYAIFGFLSFSSFIGFKNSNPIFRLSKAISNGIVRFFKNQLH